VKRKFICKGRRDTRNLVIEVGSLVRRKIFKTKLKIRWHTYNTGDYVAVNDATSAAGIITKPVAVEAQKPAPYARADINSKTVQHRQKTTNE
jgi:hypothetical protein